MKRISLLLALGLAVLAPAGCKIVKTAPPATGAAADPDAEKIAGIVAQTYDAKLLPLITGTATDAATLLPKMRADLDAAGKAAGHQPGADDAAWVFAVKGSGTVTAEDRKSRAATLDVDVNGDGKADLTLQLGPVVMGTALRDIAPFYDFNDFRDQIQFARLARALNDRAAAALKPGTAPLLGKTVSFTGVFEVHSGSEKVMVLPIALSVAP